MGVGVDISGNLEKRGVRACFWELRIGGCLAQGLSDELGALVVLFINKEAPASVGWGKWDTPNMGVWAVQARWDLNWGGGKSKAVFV